MAGTEVRLEIAGGVAWITLDGPARRNALDAAAAADLTAACARVDADESVGAAVITGAGPAFCSGADTASLGQLRTAPADQLYEGLDELYGAFRRFGALRVPTVAAVNGAAVGAGLNLALAADIRLMADTAVLAWAACPPGELRPAVTALVAHLAADPPLARALAATLRRTVASRGETGWDQAVEVERARQMWSAARPRKEA